MTSHLVVSKKLGFIPTKAQYTSVNQEVQVQITIGRALIRS